MDASMGSGSLVNSPSRTLDRLPRVTSRESPSTPNDVDALLSEIDSAETLDDRSFHELLRRYPKQGGGFYSKTELLEAFRRQSDGRSDSEERRLIAKLRMKPVRTLSGVAPVTVLTRPHPCPGRCIFCPSDVRMPKSYLTDEPGAQRAAEHRFDPWGQTHSRMRTLYNIGHPIDKVELIILGGTWSSYPPEFQRWFVRRCFDAMNDFHSEVERLGDESPYAPSAVAWESVEDTVEGRSVDGTRSEGSYNQVVGGFLKRHHAPVERSGGESASVEQVAEVHRTNESAPSRCVGLVVETRPDEVDESEVRRLRELGVTKVQIGFQSLDDRVLELNRRGHDTAITRRAVDLLRQAGFKLHAHWMANLYGSSPQADVRDFARMFGDPALRPDELKLYPCSLIESAELMQYWQDGRWRPYDYDELLEVVVGCMVSTPEYCRLTRVIRDIPGTDIVSGNRLTNFRQIAEREARERGAVMRDIRAREVRGERVDPERLRLREVRYATSVGVEVFLQSVTPENRLAGFLRLSLPRKKVFLDEIESSAMIREVHVYGQAVSIGQRGPRAAQHSGLGRGLVERAASLARDCGFRDLAVVSAVGTREYYRGLGFRDGDLYQHRPLH